MTEQLWGGETTKAVDNFPVSGERVPVPVIRWLGRLKAAAARANGELGGLDAALAERIATAGDAVAAGEHDDQFPVDVFQTGSGTSSNMNANEVIANLAGDGAHPNDHVNMGQSSNDVFPSAVHLAALGEVTRDLLPAMGGLEAALEEKAGAVRRRGQGRPHPPDGRGAGHARPGVRRLRGAGAARHPAGRVGAGPGRPDPPGRHRDRDRPQHPPRVRRQGAGEAGRRDRPGDLRAARHLRGAGQPRRAGRAVGDAQGLRGLPQQDRQRPGADGLGPAHRTGRAAPPRAAEGLVDHARQGQPGDPGGGDPGRRPGDRQRRRDHGGGKPGPVRAERAGAADRPQPARLDQAARLRLPPAEREVRGGDRGERGDDHAPRRGDPGERHRPQPPHRLRPRRRDRQGGGRVGPPAARGGAGAGRRDRRPRRGPGPPQMARPHE